MWAQTANAIARLPVKCCHDFRNIKDMFQFGSKIKLAERVEDGRQVVLKQFLRTHRRKLERELSRIVCIPSHPLIIRYNAIVIDGDEKVYLEMPRYLEGSLTHWMGGREAGTLDTASRPEASKRRLLRQLLKVQPISRSCPIPTN